MKILSLDLSTKSSGYAVFDKAELIDYGCFTSSSTDLIKRIQIMTDGIKTIMEKYPEIEKVIVEEVRPEGRGYGVGNLQTHRALMWLQAAIAFMLHDNYKKTELMYIYPSSWRASIGIKTGRGIKRTTLKEKDVEFVKEQWNIDVNDDIADAICIGYANVNNIETEINWD